MGLANAVRRLQKSEAKSKVCILLTDGVNNSGEITPIQAADAAKKYGVKVYTIGVGTMGKANGPIARRPDGGFIFGSVDVEIDEDLLKDIAQKTGGKYYRATNLESLEEVYKEIDKMEKTKIEKTTLRRNRDEFKWFVFLALFSIILYIVFANTIFRSIVQ
jgi:Ca-activated chloride channel family protein